MQMVHSQLQKVLDIHILVQAQLLYSSDGVTLTVNSDGTVTSSAGSAGYCRRFRYDTRV